MISRSDAESLGSLEPGFAVLLSRNGPPPDWRRTPTFSTLVRLILEQQVSLASATAAYRRLEDRLGAVEPAALLRSTDAELRADGFSRQKARYVRLLADRIETGAFDPEGLDPADADAQLLQLTGVGPWTSACFRLFALGDPDVWPRGDRALHVSMAKVFDLAVVPDSDVAEHRAAGWSPYRSTAARMLWHDYLGGASYLPSPDAGFLE